MDRVFIFEGLPPGHPWGRRMKRQMLIYSAPLSLFDDLDAGREGTRRRVELAGKWGDEVPEYPSLPGWPGPGQGIGRPPPPLTMSTRAH